MNTADKVRAAMAEGLTQAEAARQLGISRSVVCNYVRTLGIPYGKSYKTRLDYSPELAARARSLIDAGASIPEIRETLGITDHQYRKLRRIYALYLPPSGIPEEDCQRVRELIEVGRWRESEVAALYGVTQSTVSKYLCRHEITPSWRRD